MIIAHDLGTTGDKAALYCDDGRVVAAESVAYRTVFGPGGKAEQDADHWWEASVSATRRLLERSATQAASVECVSFSGQMMGALLLDGSGRPVRPAIIWADTRSTQECEELSERVGMDRAYRITGHRLNPTYSLSKLMWVRRREPESWSRARTVVQAKDYLAFKLTGTIVTDPSDASGTNAYDQQSGVWSDELLAAAEVDAGLLPEIVPSTTVIGPVSAEAAEATGLHVGTPVVIGGGDGPLAALGAGIVSPDSGANVYLGSSSWISLATDSPLHDRLMRTMTFNHVVPGRFVPMATMQAGGASRQWLADVLEPLQDSERFRRLDSEAAHVASEDLLFLPHLLGERSPYWNPRARGAFIGLAGHHTRADLVRAVMEGVAFNLRTCLLAFHENGISIDRIDAVGGGAASDEWMQVLADVWAVPVRRRSLIEANTLGAAIVGGVAIGVLPSFDVATALSSVEATFPPNFERSATLAKRYARFMDAYARLEPFFDAS
jgi:xylulokinase